MISKHQDRLSLIPNQQKNPSQNTNLTKQNQDILDLTLDEQDPEEFPNMTQVEQHRIDKIKQQFEQGKKLNRENMHNLTKVAPFLNTSHGQFQQPFKGSWHSTGPDQQPLNGYFEHTKGNATILFNFYSYDYDEKRFAYSLTKHISNSTIYTKFDIKIILQDSKYLDNFVQIEASSILGYESQNKMVYDHENRGPVKQASLLTVNHVQNCSLNISFRFENATQSYIDQQFPLNLIIGNNDEHQLHDQIYKVLIKIENADKNEICFPNAIEGEFYNIDFSNLKGKLFRYCMIYMGLTIILIYAMVFEYVKITQDQRENANNISLFSLGIHSIWNLLSIVIHLILSYQLFSTHSRLVWAPVICNIILHFLIQRKMIVAVWKAQQTYILVEQQMRNSELKCYSRYYFFVFIFLISVYKILTVDIFMVLFFGTIWIPQIIVNHILGQHSRYHLSPGFVFFSSCHFIFFPVYMRGCPENLFMTQPHQSTVVIIVTSITLQFLTLLFQSVRNPIRYLPRRMRRRMRSIIRERNRRLRSEGLSHQYFRKFNVKQLGNEIGSSIATTTTSTSAFRRVMNLGLRKSKKNRQHQVLHDSITSAQDHVKDEIKNDIEQQTVEILTEEQIIYQSDCVICLTPLRYHPSDLNPDGSGISNTENQDSAQFTKGYMLTPCNHKYHKKCLLQWMNMKMDCPTCRQRLPRIEDYDDLGSGSDTESDLEINMRQN
eukprot:403338328